MTQSTEFANSKATLATLCRVNLYFLEITRPLLYYEIHLDPSRQFGGKTSSTYSKIVHSLVLSRPCAAFVKSIKITWEVNVIDIELILLAISLKGCTGLERLSTGWNEWKGSKADRARLFEIVSEDAASVKHLEIGNIDLPIQTTLELARSLRRLDTLVFRPIDIDKRLPPQFRLRQVVWVTRLSDLALKLYLLPSSSDSLTILSCLFDYRDPPMLDSFPNLSTLRLILDIFHTLDTSSNTSKHLLYEGCLNAIRTTLVSTHSLAVKHLTISTMLPETAESVTDYCMLDYLPPTIVSFTAVPQLFSILNLPSLVQSSTTAGIPSYPDLRRLTITPPLFTRVVDGETYKFMETTLRRVSKVLASKGVGVIVDLGAKLGEHFGWVEACPV